MFAEVLPPSLYEEYRSRLAALLQIPRSASDQEIHKLIEAGFPPTALRMLCEIGQISPIERDRIAPRKSLETLLARGRQLSVRESDRLFRHVHIIAMAEAIFGNEEKARRWLRKIKIELCGHPPMAMLTTSPGTRRVEEMLIQVAEGFAF